MLTCIYLLYMNNITLGSLSVLPFPLFSLLSSCRLSLPSFIITGVAYFSLTITSPALYEVLLVTFHNQLDYLWDKIKKIQVIIYHLVSLIYTRNPQILTGSSPIEICSQNNQTKSVYDILYN